MIIIEMCIIMPRWAEPRQHTVVGLCVCVCVCICMSVTRVSRRSLQAKYAECNAGTTRQYLKLNSLDFWFKVLFSSYSVTCSPWRPLREIQSQAKTKLFTAGCFFTRQSRLCHRPGSNMSKNMKTRLSKASCHLLVRRSVAAIKGVAA